MNSIITKIEKIKYEVKQKELIYSKIKKLEELLKSPYINFEQNQKFRIEFLN